MVDGDIVLKEGRNRAHASGLPSVSIWNEGGVAKMAAGAGSTRVWVTTTLRSSGIDPIKAIN